MNLSRPTITRKRRKPKLHKTIPAHHLQTSVEGSKPVDHSHRVPPSTSHTSSHQTHRSGKGGGMDMSELRNALKRRKNKSRPPSLANNNNNNNQHRPAPAPHVVVQQIKPPTNRLNNAPKGLSKSLHKVASSKGFKRLIETPTRALPPRTPRVPHSSSSTSSSSKKTTQNNSSWETGDVRWVKTKDKQVGSEGNDYVVAKFIETTNNSMYRFELVDWSLDNGTHVNGTFNAMKEHQSFQVSIENIGPRIETSTELNNYYADMVNLPVVHQATVLHNLKQRYLANQFMTNIGSILIIINPFDYFPELYSLDVVRQYTDGHGGDSGDAVLPPHVYGIAQRAYRNLIRHRTNQALIIAGESGAGKTESTKKCLQYLAEVGGTSSGAGTGKARGSNNETTEESMEDRILSANPVFEAFGNAKTVRNNNSSRFGKWLEIMYHPQSLKIVGCQTTQYLLEKTRVVQVAKGEKNYSIFYQLLACGNEQMLHSKLLSSSTPNYYHYLTENNRDGGARRSEAKTSIDMDTEATSSTTIADRDHFDMTIDAMSSLGFNQNKTNSILSIVSSILHLGNIHFEDNSEGNAGVLDTTSKEHLQSAASCLAVDVDELCLALTHKRLMIVRERTDKPLTIHGATDTRNALSKALYAQLFSTIVELINASMRPDQRPDQSGRKPIEYLCIGVLDIFGFEIFEHNSLEQLCINFANEKLQGIFNRSVVEDEINTCLEEGVTLPTIGFNVDSGIVGLMETKSIGMLVMLDEELRVVGGTDQGWMRKVLKTHTGNKKDLITDRPPKTNKKHHKNQHPTAQDCFWVKHYAGTTCYHYNGFLDKNRDVVPDSLLEVVQSSRTSFVAQLFPSTADTGQNTSTKRRKKKTKSLLGTFRKSLNVLIATLEASTPHYIRCIKPNSIHAPLQFYSGLIDKQLNCSGLHDVIRLRKEGYSYRLLHSNFVKRFYPLLRYQSRKGKGASRGLSKAASMRTLLRTRTSAEQAHDIIAALSHVYPSLDSECVVGKTKVLIRELPYQWMEKYLDVVRDRASRLVQKYQRSRKVNSRKNAILSSKHMLKNAIESGDLKRAQELLQIARKKGFLNNGNEGGKGEMSLFREAAAIETMLIQSRAMRQLNNLSQLPVSELWTQRKLLASLVAGAQTGDLNRRSSIGNPDELIATSMAILDVCTAMEKSVLELDKAILSGNGLQASITQVQELSRLHGTYCVVSLNNAKTLLNNQKNGKDNNQSPSFIVTCREVNTLDSSNPTSRRERQRNREKALQSKVIETNELQKSKAIDMIEMLKQSILDTEAMGNKGDIDQQQRKDVIINHLASVVQEVEQYAMMQ